MCCAVGQRLHSREHVGPSEEKPSRRARVCAALLGLSLYVAPGHVSAHDPPFGTGVFKRGDALLVRTNRGLILRASSDDDFKLLCNEGLGINTSEVPTIVPLEEERWLIGSSQGLVATNASLCELEDVTPLEDVAVPALARDPHDASRVYVSTGQAGFDNGLFVSDDDGRTFEAYGSRDPDRLFDRLLVSPLVARTLFASGLRRRDGVNGFITFVAASNDQGETFVEHEIALHDDEYAAELLGVHPKLAEVVFAVAHADLGTGVLDRFLVSRDRGKTFTEALAVDKLEAFTVDDTGANVLVGARDGLWSSSDDGETFLRIQQRPIHCLAWHDGLLYVCDESLGSAGISTSDDAGKTLSALMRFTDVDSQVSCPSTSAVATACVMAWYDWMREQRAGFALDGGFSAGSMDASAADSGNVATTPDAGSRSDDDDDDDGSGGCAVVACGRRTSSPSLAALTAALLGLLFRRRRARSRRA